jgi:hypothetical protein
MHIHRTTLLHHQTAPAPALALAPAHAQAGVTSLARVIWREVRGDLDAAMVQQIKQKQVLK